MGKNALLVAAGAALVMASVTSATVNAWHPKGVIVKKVQNQTTGSALQDANTVNAAVSAKEGDVLKYVITVRNSAQQAQNNWNDMAYTVMTDTLPEGVVLVGDPSKRTIREDMGTIKPQHEVTKEYLVKVVSKKGSEVITNKACFTGDSKVKDNPQNGCDVAVVKTKVPVTPEKPEKPEKPVEKPAEKPVKQPKEVPAELPSTGIEQVLSGLTGASALAYSTVSYIRSRRQ